MADESSVTHWIEELKGGQEGMAQQELWNRYFRRLAALARRKLRHLPQRAEDEEEPPYLLFTITDEAGQVVRRLKAPAKAGMQRITWDLRWPDIEPVDENSKPFSGNSLLAMPGKYQVSFGKCVDGQYTA